jgi:hypothetical protein
MDGYGDEVDSMLDHVIVNQSNPPLRGYDEGPCFPMYFSGRFNLRNYMKFKDYHGIVHFIAMSFPQQM